MVRRFMSSHPTSLFRPRVLHPWVVATTTPTLWAESTVNKAGTDKRSDALLAVTPAPRRGDVSHECVCWWYVDNWSEKAKGRNTQGTGRMRYLKHVVRRAKNGFREGTQALSRKRKAPAAKWGREMRWALLLHCGDLSLSMLAQFINWQLLNLRTTSI